MVFLNYLINGISLGSIYAIIALGYTMVYGIAKMLNFAHGDVIMVGAYICFFSMNGLSSLFAPGSLAALVVPASKLVGRGLAQVPEGRRVFQQMTVEENLEMGGFTQPASTIAPGLERVYEQFPRLKERRRQVAGTLSGGEQQMLAMGRALMSNPKLLMLDEPSMGLAPLLVEQIFAIIKELHRAGTTILLVEQNAQMALSVADRGYVLETGRVTLTGPGRELLADEAVKKAYLGG